MIRFRPQPAAGVDPSCTATISAPLDVGFMGWTLNPGAVTLTDALSSGFLAAGDDVDRGYNNATALTAPLEHVTAWAATDWETGTGWSGLDMAQQANLIEGLVATLIDFDVSNAGTGGGTGTGGPTMAAVPLPATSLLLIAGLCGLAALRRQKL